MPVFLLIAGVIFLVAAIKGNQTDLVNLLKSDFSGQNNFLLWVMAIIIIVAFGYFEKIKPVSDAFLGLVILVIIVYNYKNNKNIFQSFIDQVKAGTSSDGPCT